jgi:hypothetical protein
MLLLLQAQVILGSSVEEALAWAQQDGSLPPAQAQLISAAMAAKGEPFNSEHRHLVDLHPGPHVAGFVSCSTTAAAPQPIKHMCLWAVRGAAQELHRAAISKEDLLIGMLPYLCLVRWLLIGGVRAAAASAWCSGCSCCPEFWRSLLHAGRLPERAAGRSTGATASAPKHCTC